MLTEEVHLGHLAGSDLHGDFSAHQPSEFRAADDVEPGFEFNGEFT